MTVMLMSMCSSYIYTIYSTIVTQHGTLQPLMLYYGPDIAIPATVCCTSAIVILSFPQGIPTLLVIGAQEACANESQQISLVGREHKHNQEETKTKLNLENAWKTGKTTKEKVNFQIKIKLQRC